MSMLDVASLAPTSANAVWFIDSATGQYRLTTKGLQLQLQLDAQDRRAA